MRNFVVSDLHGNGNMYNAIMAYLDNISKNEEVTLFINGDLIDKGLESADILVDIYNRIKTKSNLKIEYLAGNHELMMYHHFTDKYRTDRDNIWYYNDGDKTEEDINKKYIDKKDDLIELVSNLKVFHKFEEKINNKNIILVHAGTIPHINLDLKIKDDNANVDHCVWIRRMKVNKYSLFNDDNVSENAIIGHKDYFTIIGHTPTTSNYGFEYFSDQNYLNIDGGCARYVKGLFEYDHVPLVEIKDNFLRILTFNNNNEIIYGNYFEDNRIIPLSRFELNKEKNNLNKNIKIKKLVKLPNNQIGYEE